jgi:omega-hydroxy-beta-dihydromenaquinone-9 sulfotransferase
MGRAALSWVLEGGKPQRGPASMRWAYRWNQFWFDLNLKMLDQGCSPEAALHPPVFIMGMWRSGTTFLHDLLSTNRALLACSTWQCMNSSIHALRQPPHGAKSLTRPMDGLSISMESPQEDEFALLAQGVPSVYRGFFDPRRLSELEEWLNPQSWADLPAETWWPRWRRFLASVQRGQDRRLVLKSPNHTFRWRAILRELPQSTLIWVVRDPREVFWSNVKMWKAMFQQYALWQPDEATIDSLLNHFLECALRYSSVALTEAISALPRTQLVVLHFDDLIERPLEMVERIHKQISLPWSSVAQDSLLQMIAQAAGLPRERYAERPLPTHLDAMCDIKGVYAAALRSHGIVESD